MSDLVPHVAEGLTWGEQFLGTLANGVDSIVTQRLDERMTAASNSAEVVRKEMVGKIAKARDEAGEALKRL